MNISELEIKMGRVEKSLYVMECKCNEATAYIRKHGEENMTAAFMADYQGVLAGWDGMKALRSQLKAQIKAAC